MTKSEEEKYIENGWKSICEYVKRTYNAFPNKVEIEWKHDVYSWTKFVVIPEGEARIAVGSHPQSLHELVTPTMYANVFNANIRSDSRESELKRFVVKNGDARRLGIIKKVIMDWNIIRERLDIEKEAYDRLLSFSADGNRKTDYYKEIEELSRRIKSDISKRLPESGDVDINSKGVIIIRLTDRCEIVDSEIRTISRDPDCDGEFIITVEGTMEEGREPVTIYSDDSEFDFNNDPHALARILSALS